ncbi:ABC transporter permease [Deinococcus radiophilus]|uniref:ABC transporter permease n=2 Tax=Deinococcus radiophilus TaxID=32062 RepID=A0A431VVR2_9DEIO|nr:ABC transporter permease [Deinococcus radiophilus]RTR27293.1 ABC transporter permease [Deinococcus radiophilus]UFA50619.1 ABC transporter permease [Deinococcus radiophilus]
MFNLIVKRLLQIPLIMLVLSMLVLGLTMLLTPQQRASFYVRNEQMARRIDEIIRERGLDQPFFVQYWNWLESALKGDLGFSKAVGEPVVEAIMNRLPNTVELTLYAFIPIIVLGVWLGTLSALRKDGLIDQIIRVLAVLAFSVPAFVLGIVLLAVFYGYLGWAPGPGQLVVENRLLLDQLRAAGEFQSYTGMLSIDAMLNGQWGIARDVLAHLVLPVITLSLVITASIVKLMRNSMLETLTSDFVRTARAKGLSERVVNNKHARRNALIPIINSGGFILIGLLTGSLITESIFAYPGIGSWLLTSASQMDIPAVLGYSLFVALVVVVLRTLIDIGFAVVDPRVRYD